MNDSKQPRLLHAVLTSVIVDWYIDWFFSPTESIADGRYIQNTIYGIRSPNRQVWQNMDGRIGRLPQLPIVPRRRTQNWPNWTYSSLTCLLYFERFCLLVDKKTVSGYRFSSQISNGKDLEFSLRTLVFIQFHVFLVVHNNAHPKSECKPIFDNQCALCYRINLKANCSCWYRCKALWKQE